MLKREETPQLAIVVPCFNEELCVQNAADKLSLLLKDLISKNKIKETSYIFFVDDGSKDSTWTLIKELHEKNSFVKGRKFIKNFGNQKALIAGLEGVRDLGCDCVVTIDADLQQDEIQLPTFYQARPPRHPPTPRPSPRDHARLWQCKPMARGFPSTREIRKRHRAGLQLFDDRRYRFDCWYFRLYSRSRYYL